jgi:hypothetical protein
MMPALEDDVSSGILSASFIRKNSERKLYAVPPSGASWSLTALIASNRDTPITRVQIHVARQAFAQVHVLSRLIQR